MATLTLEDMSGQAVITVFPSAFNQYAHLLGKDRLVVVRGHLQHRDVSADGSRRVEVIVRSVEPLGEPEGDDSEEADHESIAGTIQVQVLKASVQQLQRAHELIRKNPGDFALTLEVGSNGSTRTYKTSYRVSDGPWVSELRRTLEVAFVRVHRTVNAFTKHAEIA